MKEPRVYRYRWVVLIIYMYLTALTQALWLNFSVYRHLYGFICIGFALMDGKLQKR